jgi:hypothetical protein
MMDQKSGNFRGLERELERELVLSSLCNDHEKKPVLM